MDLKDKIISAEATNAVSKKTNAPYARVDVLLKGADGLVVSKPIFIFEHEKKLLNI